MLARRNYWLFFLFFVFFCLYWLRSSILLDTDFGWHIRMGQFILEKGIPSTDIFSYTMPHFPMVDHEWLTNVFLSIVFPVVHFWGLAVLFSALGVGSFFIQLFRQKGNTYLSALLLLLSGLSIYSFVGIRPQVITWFLFSIFALLLLEKGWQKRLWFLPLLQLLWVNLHGGFAVGVFFVGIVFVLESFLQRRFVGRLFVVFLLCLFASFINPYGVRIWGEVWMQLSDNSLRFTITEWRPAIYYSNLAFWIYVLFFVFLLIRYWRVFAKDMFVPLGCAVVFLLMAFSSMRHIPLWVIISLPVSWKGFRLFSEEAAEQPFGRERFTKGIRVLLGLLIFILLPQVWSMFQTLRTYSSATVYPVTAVVYLRKHIPPRKIFALYDWNSFILWQIPETKIFIDGMMPSWRWFYSTPHESSYAFLEYQEVLRGKIALSTEIQKYGIDCVVLPADSFSLDDKFQGYSISGLESQVKKLGWKMVYRDTMAVVYRP